MAEAINNGQMAASMKATSRTIKPMEEVGSFMLRVKFMMASGKIINHMALVSILFLTGPSTRAIGSRINSMAKGRNIIQMGQSTKEAISMGRRKEWEISWELISRFIVVNSRIIIYMVTEPINGRMEENIKEPGLIIKCMEKGYSRGQMGENMWENILMIKNRVMEFSIGPMEDNTMGIG